MTEFVLTPFAYMLEFLHYEHPTTHQTQHPAPPHPSTKMAVPGWQVDTATDRMGGSHEEESWGFVMKEADRADRVAREAAMREWEAEQARKREALWADEQARLEEEHRQRLAEQEAERQRFEDEVRRKEEEVLKGQELRQDLYEIERKKREDEVKQMIADDRASKQVNGDHRLAQWYAHRDSRMRTEQQKTQQPLASLADDREALGFRSPTELYGAEPFAHGTPAPRHDVRTAMQQQEEGLIPAHLWSADELVGRPGVVQPDAVMREPALPPRSVVAATLPAGAAEAAGYPTRDAAKWGARMHLKYADPAVPAATPTTEEPPTPADRTVQRFGDWEQQMKERLGKRRERQPRTTDQLLRQHYNRVLAPERHGAGNAHLPTAEDRATAKTLTHFHDNVWERRTGASALERLLRSRQVPPSALPQDSALHTFSQHADTHPALEGAAGRTPQALVVSTAAFPDLNGTYTLQPHTVFSTWEKGAHRICVSHGAWVIGHATEDHLSEGGAPVRSSSDDQCAMPHEVERWEWRATSTTPYAPADAEHAITVTLPEEGEGDGAEGEVDPTAAPPDTTPAETTADPTAASPEAQPDAVVSPEPGTEGAAPQPESAASPQQPPIVTRTDAALASGEWRAKLDPKTQRTYYINKVTKKTCWNLEKELEKQGVPLPVLPTA